MGFNDEYLKLRKKRLEEQQKQTSNTLKANDIAPVKSQNTVLIDDARDIGKKNTGSGLFKAGAFADGYQFGDVSKVILGTAGDVASGLVQGVAGIGEGLGDLAMYGVAGVQDLVGNDDDADRLRDATKDEVIAPLFDSLRKKTNIDDTSLLGDFGYSIAQGVGQVGAIIATGGAGSAAGLGTVGTSVVTSGMIGASSMGSGMSEAYQGGATDEEALEYGTMQGVIEVISNLIFGGLGKSVKALGVSKGLTSIDDVFAKKLSSKMSNQFLKNATQYGVKAGAEGLEEVLAGLGSAAAKKLTYMSDEELLQLVEDENLLEQFAAGALVSGIAQGGDLVKSTKQGRDFITNFSGNEETVIEKVYNDRVAEAEQDGTKLTNKEKNKLYEQVQEDMRKGYISTDDIESVLGGETYKTYKDTIDSEDAILKEFDELGKKQNATLAEQSRYAELQEKVKEIKSNSNRNNLKSQLSEEVYNSVKEKDFYLAESYNEKARRGTAFEADLSQYDDKTAETVKRAIDSGILNNTRRTHEFVDMVAKISADKGVLFDFTNNQKLKDSGFAVDGATVNGYHDKATNTIGVNISSSKATNTIVGHEITHVLEGTELYEKLQSAVFDYAKAKGEYYKKRADLVGLYKNVEGVDYSAELTADLVGDYLFTDEDFINNLSTKHRNVFQKIYDEIKYLCKIATAGSKEARELEKVKRAFDKAYRANGNTSEGTKYSLSDSDGTKLTKEQSEYFKDSKMRDDNGNLKVMYHGSQDAGFHVFDANMSDDDTSFFFVDSNDVAASYSGTSETYEAQTIRTAEDMNNFIESIGVDGYEVVEKDGKFTLLYEGDRIADSNTAKGIYEEFCWYEGVGEGDANYKVYLNITNPLEVDAEGRNWNNISREFSQEVYGRYKSLTAEEKAALSNLAEWGEYSIFKDEMLDARAAAEQGVSSGYGDVAFTKTLARAYAKLGGANANLYDAFSIAQENFSEESLKEFAVKQMNTRDYARKAKAEGYDGVIFKNIVDNGGYSNGSEGASIVAIAFESNQIKSVANEKPTSNPDIRYSLSNPQTDKDYLAAVERGDTETAQKIVEDVAKESGYTVRAYHGTARGDRVGNVFLPERSTSGPMAFFTDNKDIAANYARDKADTSMAYDPDYDRYETQFRIKTKYNDVPLYSAWRYLPLDARNRITEKAGQLREDWDGDNELILDPETNEANGGFQWQLKEARGNAIQALMEQWLNSGTLYNEEARFLDVLEKAGVTEEFKKIGMDSLYFKDPNAKHEKVYDTFLKIAKPFDTSTVDEAFVRELEAWYEEQDQTIYERETAHADMWDKNNIDAYDFAERLRNDIENGTSHSWTSIPDSVTDYLKSLGYDGIKDVGGKNGGIGHTVWIPFSSEQVKSAEPITYDDNGKVIPLSERFNANDNDIRYSLSKEGETPKRYGNYNIFGEDIRLEAPIQEDVAPVDETVDETVTETVAPTAEAKTEVKAEAPEKVVGDFAPMPNEPTIYDLEQKQAELENIIRKAMESNDPNAPKLIDEYGELLNTIAERKKEESAIERERLASLEDADAPPEMEAPYYGEGREYSEFVDPFNDRDIKAVGNRKVKAYMYENPEVKPFFQEEAQSLWGELQDGTKGEKIYTPVEGGVPGAYGSDSYGVWSGTKRHVSPDIAYLLDNLKLSYADIEKGLNAIVEDNGAENNAASKRIGFILNDRLLKGYTDFTHGYDIPPNQDYINLIKEKQITEYSEEARAKFFEEADKYAPPMEDIAPIAPVAENTIVNEPKIDKPIEDAPIVETAKKTEIPPTFDTAKKSQIEGQQTVFKEPEISTKEQPIKTIKDRLEHKLHASYGELSHNKRLRREALEDFDKQIAALQQEYDSKKNKTTKIANDILRRIERLKRIRAQVDADWTKRINDNRANVEKYKAKFEEGFDEATGREMRSDIHAKKVDDIKAKFTKSGLDLDETLKNAKNLSTFATVDNTPQRVMEKSLGYKAGQILADETVNKVAQNESEGIKWLNSFTDRKNGVLAKLSKKYNIKPGSKESAAAQMYAEGFYVDDNNDIIKYGDAELAKDFPNITVQKNIKGLAKDQRIRQIYDETLDAINESRARNAYPEIQKLDNYFLHFRAMDDTFSRLGLPFNPNDIRAKDLPTDLNGVTADLKPGQPYFASAKHREGKRTSFDLLGGLEKYLTSAKNQIYHIDDIQTLRALRNYVADTYGQANGLEGLDSLTEEEAQERIKQVYSSHLSTFAKFLNEEANVLAGKTALIDRGIEGIIGRRGITFLDTINKQVGANMVGFNVSSSLTNFLAGVQAIAKTNKLSCVKSFAQTTSSKINSLFGKTDSFVENNPTIIRRKGAERFYRTPFQKVGDAGYVLMSAVDNVTTEFIVRAKYDEFIKQGMSEQQAITEADKWTSRVMGDRSLGQMPHLYNSKMLGLVTKFQLEVRNQLDSQFYDTIQEAKASNEDIKNGLARNAKTAAKVTATLFELAVLQHLFGKAFESVAGYNPAFDIIDVLIKTLGLDDDEEDEDTVLDNVEEGFLALLEDLPYTSILTGGRIPISAALPITELIKGEDEYGNEKSRLETLGEIAPYYILPTGYGQYKKTKQGLSMFDDDLPISGSYTDKGDLRFPIEDTPENRIQAGVFGQWASENARDYFDNERAPLKEKQIQEIYDFLEKNDISFKEYISSNEETKKAYAWAAKNPEKFTVSKAITSDVVMYQKYTSDLNNITSDKDKYGKSISGSRKEKVIEYVNNLDIEYGARLILFKSEYNADDTYNYDIIDYLNNRQDISYEDMETILKELGFTVLSDGTIQWD